MTWKNINDLNILETNGAKINEHQQNSNEFSITLLVLYTMVGSNLVWEINESDLSNGSSFLQNKTTATYRWIWSMINVISKNLWVLIVYI